MEAEIIHGLLVYMAHRDNEGHGANDGYDGETWDACERAPHKVYKAESLNAVLAAVRRERIGTNGPMNPREHVYAAPVLTLLDDNFCIVHKRPWSRTEHDVRELIEVAEAMRGWVFIEQDIHFLDVENAWADEGFALEVFPRLRVRPPYI